MLKFVYRSTIIIHYNYNIVDVTFMILYKLVVLKSLAVEE